MSGEVPAERLDRGVEQMRARLDDEQLPRIRVAPGRPRRPRHEREPAPPRRRRRRRQLSHTTLWQMRNPLTARDVQELWGDRALRAAEVARHLVEQLASE